MRKKVPTERDRESERQT